MKPLEERSRKAITGGTFRQQIMTADAEDLSHLFSIVSDKLYTNRIAAVLREYTCNAWDAHVDAGKPDLPVQVGLPTVLDPILIIRDFGKGLSRYNVFVVYWKMAKSTKRHTNKLKGMFGLGAKAGYAYTSSFTVVSFHGGQKMTFSAFLNENKERVLAEVSTECHAKYVYRWLDVDMTTESVPEKPTDYVNLLQVLWDDERTDDENYARIDEFCAWLGDNLDDDAETGMEIRIPVQKNDISQFHREAARIFRFFSPVPDCGNLINIEPLQLEGIYLEEAKTRLIREWRGVLQSQWVVVMGNVAYDVPLQQLKDSLSDREKEDTLLDLLKFVGSSGGLIHVDIGELEPSPSRESLALTNVGKKYLLRKFKQIQEAMSNRIMQILSAQRGKMSSWTLRKHLRHELSAINMRKKSIDGFELEGHVELDQDDTPETFNIRELRVSAGKNGLVYFLTQARFIPRSGNTVLVIRDTDKAIRRLRYFNGDCIDYTVLVVDPVEKDLSFSKKELDQYLKKYQVDGIPTRALSTFPEPSKESLAGRDKDGNPLPPVSHTEEKRAMYSGSLFAWTGKAKKEGAGRPTGRWRNGREVKTKGTIRHSDNWEIVDEAPDGAVYVVLERFVPDYGGGFLKEKLRGDENLLKALFGFSSDMPDVVGVKQAHIDKHGPPDGLTHLRDWVGEKFVAGVQSSKEVRQFLRAVAWAGIGGGIQEHVVMSWREYLPPLSSKLGKTHPLPQLLKRVLDARDEVEMFCRLGGGKGAAYKTLKEIVVPTKKEREDNSYEEVYPGVAKLKRAHLARERHMKKRLKMITEKYPWLGAGGMLDIINMKRGYRRADAIVEYVNLIDYRDTH